MKRIFKNALCREFRPDAYGFKHGNYWECCKRRAGHAGPHRTNRREWNDGDRESRLRKDLKETTYEVSQIA